MADEAAPSVEAQAVRGATWTIGAGLVSRGLGLVGSVAITHYLDPDAVGEVGAALVLVLTASQLSTFGIGNFVIARKEEGPSGVFHATVFHVLGGILALGLVVALAAPLSALVHARHAAVFVPGLALAVMLDRVGYVPERVVLKALRFRRIAGTRAIADIAYTASSLGLAMLGFGGSAIVLGVLLRSAIRSTVYVVSAERREWLAVQRLSMAVYRRMLHFGVPLWFSGLLEFAAMRWDNLVVSYFFGPRVMAEYQVAYNLADVPADQIGEQVAEVLLPSFARMSYEERKLALVSSTGILSFVVFPVAIGFGAIAHTLIAVALRPVWANVAPMLAILCVLSVLRPLGWQVGAYLVANNRPRVLMLASLLKLTVLLGTLLTVGRFGPLYACLAVGSGFAASLLFVQASIARTDGVPMSTQLARCVPPLLACIPMVLAVLGVRHGLARAGLSLRVSLPLEILAGVVGYIVGAFTLARTMTREFLSLVAAARGRRRT